MQYSFQRAIGVIALGTLAAFAIMAQAQQKQWKDRAEYDLFDSINKEQNLNTKLQLLNSWKQKYAASDFKVDRQTMIMATYQGLNNGREMLNAAKELVSIDPKNASGLNWICVLTVALQDKTPEGLDSAEKAAKGLLAVIPEVLDAAKKPAQVSDDAWKAERATAESKAHRTLGWIAMQRNANEDAEKEFVEALKSNPGDAEVSYWTGTVVAKQRKIEKQAAAMYHFARAAYMEGPGALPDATRKPLQAYLEKTYVNFHGDKEGLDKLIEAAKANPIPTQDVKIKSKDEILLEQEEALKKSNPQLALWVNIKRELSGPNGQQYFETSLKGAAIPGGVGGVAKLKATVVSSSPEKKTTNVVVGISSKEMSEITLKFEKPLAAPVPPGTEVEFSGAPSAFEANPFNLTFDVSLEDVNGLPKPPAPVKKAPVAAKKAATKKK